MRRRRRTRSSPRSPFERASTARPRVERTIAGCSPLQFIVLRQGGKWSVKSQDLDRSFADQSAATRAAVDLANHSGKNGKPAVVIVQLAKDRFKTVWTYGQDAYPPAKFDLPRVEEDSATAATE